MDAYVWIIIILGLISEICIACKFASLAEEKGHNGLVYGLICFFFSVVGYCMVAALADRNMMKKLKSIEEKIDQVQIKPKSQTVEKPIKATPQIAEEKKAEAEVNPIAPDTCEDGEIICPVCHTKQRADRTICWSCGQKFS